MRRLEARRSPDLETTQSVNRLNGETREGNSQLKGENMNDARRFMRFVLPGLASVIMLLIALFISDGSKMSFFFDSKSSNYVGVIFGLFLASGALGYIFSNIYWAIFWIGPKKFFVNDNSFFLEKYKDKLKIVDKPNELTKHEVWIIVTQFWYAQIKKSDEIKGINPFIDRIIDIGHGLGSTLVGSFISLITWISLHFFVIANPSKCSCGNFMIIFVWLILIISISFDYNRIRKAHQSLVNSTIIKLIH